MLIRDSLFTILCYATITTHAFPSPQPVPPPTNAQLSINPPTSDSPPQDNGNRTITATLFSGGPGPHACRGHETAVISLPPLPDGLEAVETRPRCYNLPSPSLCGTFVAPKEDGCEGRLFGEPNCIGFVNTAVFMPLPELEGGEEGGRRAKKPVQANVGGYWRSVEIRCGVPPPDPAALMAVQAALDRFGQAGRRTKGE